MIWTPYAHQQTALSHILDSGVADTAGAGLLLDMGLGKTGVALTGIDILQNELFEVTKTLIIAPKYVAQYVWEAELRKWDHLKHLRISKILGTEKQRKEALRAKADIYVINRENIPWLVAFLTKWPFDMLVVDESSSFKNPKSLRFKAIRRVLPFIKRVVILTGTFTPNGLLDAWSQIYLVDSGKRLGDSVTKYRGKYFNAGQRSGHVVYDYNLKGQKPPEIKKKGDRKESSEAFAERQILGDGFYEKEIHEKIADVCLAMKSEDYLTLPGRIDHIVAVDLPPDVKAMYDKFEREQVLALDDSEITAINAAALTQKLLQFASGAIYNEDKTYTELHEVKLQVLEELIEQANGRPVLLGYWFKHDYERICRYLKKYKPVEIKADGAYEAWNRGEIQVGTGHPMSIGHGLNLQHGGHICALYSMFYNLELYKQFIKRLDRPGQLNVVQNYRLVCRGTQDEKAIRVLDEKDAAQDAVVNAIKELRAKWRS